MRTSGNAAAGSACRFRRPLRAIRIDSLPTQQFAYTLLHLLRTTHGNGMGKILHHVEPPVVTRRRNTHGIKSGIENVLPVRR